MPVWIQIQDLPLDWRSDAIVVRIGEKIGVVTEINKFSLYSGTVRSVRVRIMLDLARALTLGPWIPFRGTNVWVEYKFERLPNFSFLYGVLTHEIRYCSEAKEMCVAFGGNYANFGDLIRVGLNMLVKMVLSLILKWKLGRRMVMGFL